MEQEHLITGFQRQFGRRPSHTFFAPGRVNLIGEYTDFNGGNVLPAAIDLGTCFAVRSNGGAEVRVYSDAFDDLRSIDLSDLERYRSRGRWEDYVIGTLVEFATLGVSGAGMDIYVGGNLPRNSGLSSSASFTVGIAFLLNAIWKSELGRLDIIHLAQRVENNFIGLQCGIMDQFAVTMGRSDHCIQLHCESLEWSLVPLTADDFEVVIVDSRVPRKLSGSAYNQRRLECDGALSKLRAEFEVDYLCAATIDQVESCAALLDTPLQLRRARHVVSEDERVRLSARALASGDMVRFGELMLASHVSLRDDFEVSCPELDVLVDAALDVPGVLGSRMTGAGFGGCTVSLVASEAVPEFTAQVASSYAERTPYTATVIRCRAADGVKRIH